MPPRTVADFAAHGLRVSLACRCGGVQVVAPDVLDATFGPDFDLVAHHREVGRQLYCPACGERRPEVVLDHSESEPAEVTSVPIRAAG